MNSKQSGWSTTAVAGAGGVTNAGSSPELSRSCSGSRIPQLVTGTNFATATTKPPRKGILKRSSFLNCPGGDDSNAAIAARRLSSPTRVRLVDTIAFQRQHDAAIAERGGGDVTELVSSSPDTSAAREAALTAATAFQSHSQRATTMTKTLTTTNEQQSSWFSSVQSSELQLQQQHSLGFTGDPPDPGYSHKTQTMTTVSSMFACDSAAVNYQQIQQQQAQMQQLSSQQNGDKLPQSKIPKLSVTWWETNSVTGELPVVVLPRRQRTNSDQPQFTQFHDARATISDETYDNEDNVSVQSFGSATTDKSGTSVSPVTLNWSGKSTRFVPHCEKRHLHGTESAANYLTPTQRKNRTISELRKQLKQLEKLLGERDDHIQQLRGRLSELETIVDGGGYHNENLSLRQRIKDLEAAAAADRALLVQKYEISLDELRQRLADTKDSGTAAIDSVPQSPSVDLSSPNSVESPNVELIAQLMAKQEQLAHEADSYKYECAMQRNRITELEACLLKYDLHSQSTSCSNRQCIERAEESQTHLEAYKKEAVAWREISAKVQLELQSQIEQMESHGEAGAGFNNDERIGMSSSWQAGQDATDSHSKDSLIRALRKQVSQLQGNLDLATEYWKQEKRKEKRQRRSSGGSSAAMSDHGSDECQSSKCAKATRDLKKQLTTLETEKQELATLSESLQGQLEELRQQIDVRCEQLETGFDRVHELEKELSMKKTELEVAQLSMDRLRESSNVQAAKLRTAEEKLLLYETNVTPDGIPIPRNKLSRFVVETAVACEQTELTSEGIQCSMDELSILLLQYEQLGRRYSEETADLKCKLGEAASNLSVKNAVVNTLGTQLKDVQAEFEACRQKWDEERISLQQRVSEQTLIAQRVPFLEEQLQVCKEDVQLLEEKLDEEKSRFESAMDDSLAGSIISQKTATGYWQEKLRSRDQEIAKLKDKLSKVTAELQDSKMRLHLEKSDLIQKLQHSLADQQTLQAVVYVDRESREVQAYPVSENRSVTAMPDTANETTDILKGDLFDERDEQLKLLQGELVSTRRQVEILQGKIVLGENVQQNFDECEQQNKELKQKLAELEHSLEEVRSQRLLETAEFQREFRHLEREKEELKSHEKQKLLKLESEFKILQKELENVVRSYEAEKQQLKQSVARLDAEKATLVQELQTAMENVLQLQKQLQKHAAIQEKQKPKEQEKVKHDANINAEVISESSGKHSSAAVVVPISALMEEPVTRTSPVAVSNINSDEGVSQITDDSSVAKVSDLYVDATAESPNGSVEQKRAAFASAYTESELGSSSIQRSVSSGVAIVATKSQESTADSQSNDDVTVYNTAEEGGLMFYASSKAILTVEKTKKDTVLEVQHQKRSPSVGSPSHSPDSQKIMPVSPDRAMKDSGISFRTTSPDEIQAAKPESEELAPNKQPEDLTDLEKSLLQKLQNENRELTERNRDLFSKYMELEQQLWVLTESSSTTTSEGTTIATKNKKKKSMRPVAICDAKWTQTLPPTLDDILHLNVATETTTKEELLSVWVEADLVKEKLELDTLTKWYETDKTKLQECINSLRSANSILVQQCNALNEELRGISEQYAELRELHRSLCAELELYKTEDFSAKHPQTVATAADTAAASVCEPQTLKERARASQIIVRPITMVAASNSEPNLAGHTSWKPGLRRSDSTEQWKNRAGKLFRESVALEKFFRTVKYEKAEVQVELDILKGELEVSQAQYFTEREKLIHRIEELTGEPWSSDELDTSDDEKLKTIKTSKAKLTWELLELRQSLAEKERELNMLQHKYQTDMLRYQEQLFLEKSRQIHSASVSSTDVRSCGSESDTIRKQLEIRNAELKALAIEFERDKGSLDADLKTAQIKLKSTVNILHEKETCIRILERELKCYEEGIEHQRELFQKEIDELRQRLDEAEKQKQEMQQQIQHNHPVHVGTVIAKGDPQFAVEVAEVERIWKTELRNNKAIHQAEMRDLKQLLFTEKNILESRARSLHEKFTSLRNILEEKENCIRILDRELKSATDGLIAQRMKYDDEIILLRTKLLALEQASDGEATVRLGDFELQLREERAKHVDEVQKLKQQIAALQRRLTESSMRSDSNRASSSMTENNDERREVQILSAELVAVKAELCHISAQIEAERKRWEEQIAASPRSSSASEDESSVATHLDLNGSPEHLSSAAVDVVNEKTPKKHVAGSTTAKDRKSERAQVSGGLQFAVMALLQDENNLDSAERAPVHDRSKSKSRMKIAPLAEDSRTEIKEKVHISPKKEQSKANMEDSQSSSSTIPGIGVLLKEKACLEAENAKLLKKAEDLEDKCMAVEKEFSMVARELDISKRGYEAERKKLEARNEDLQKRLREVVMSMETNTELESAQRHIAELQQQIDTLCAKLQESEQKQQEMFLLMFRKGQEAARNEANEDIGELFSTQPKVHQTAQPPRPISTISGASNVNALDAQGKVWQNILGAHRAASNGSGDKTLCISDEEVLLRFLRDAVYYYVLDKEPKDHLHAIMNILKFSEKQRQDILKIKGYS